MNCNILDVNYTPKNWEHKITEIYIFNEVYMRIVSCEVVVKFIYCHSDQRMFYFV